MSLDPHDSPAEPGELGALAGHIRELEAAVSREHDRAAHREQVIDRLHAENQELRHGLLQEALGPVRNALFRLYDTAKREAAHWRAPEPPGLEHASELLETFADEVAEVLERTGAERISVKPGDAYDAGLHRPLGTEEVDAVAEGRVVEVIADGFALGDRVLRKAAVMVGRARKEGGE